MPHGNPILNNGSWDTTPAWEVELDKPNNLGGHGTHRKLQTWWLAVIRGNPTTPNWDIASTCKIRGKPGLLFIEAKAHEKELSEQNECGSRNSENRERILEAIAGPSLPAIQQGCLVLETGLPRYPRHGPGGAAVSTPLWRARSFHRAQTAASKGVVNIPTTINIKYWGGTCIHEPPMARR